MSGYSWLTLVLLAALIVFVIDLVCSVIAFDNRILNALVQAVLFAIVFGLVAAYLAVAHVTIPPATTP